MRSYLAYSWEAWKVLAMCPHLGPPISVQNKRERENRNKCCLQVPPYSRCVPFRLQLTGCESRVMPWKSVTIPGCAPTLKNWNLVLCAKDRASLVLLIF